MPPRATNVGRDASTGEQRNDGEHRQERSHSRGRPKMIGTRRAQSGAISMSRSRRSTASHRIEPAASGTCVGTTVVPMTAAITATTRPARVMRAAIDITYGLPPLTRAGPPCSPVRQRRHSDGRGTCSIAQLDFPLRSRRTLGPSRSAIKPGATTCQGTANSANGGRRQPLARSSRRRNCVRRACPNSPRRVRRPRGLSVLQTTKVDVTPCR